MTHRGLQILPFVCNQMYVNSIMRAFLKNMSHLAFGPKGDGAGRAKNRRRDLSYGILFLPSLIRLGLQSWTTVWNQPLLGIYVGLFFGAESSPLESERKMAVPPAGHNGSWAFYQCKPCRALQNGPVFQQDIWGIDLELEDPYFQHQSIFMDFCTFSWVSHRASHLHLWTNKTWQSRHCQPSGTKTPSGLEG